MENMKIIDLTPEHEELFFVCLEDWSEDMQEAGPRKKIWYDRMKDKGLRVKLALDKNHEVGGMIQYMPVEYSAAEGKDLYFICCIWVHGHKRGRGDFRKRGMGKALLRAAEEDVRILDKKGIVAWGMSIPVFMRASWFRKNGYRKIDKKGMMVLLWKPFTEDAVPPKWNRIEKKPSLVPGKVTVTAFTNGWCPAQNITFERAKRAADDLGEKVVFQEVDTLDPSLCKECGKDEALYINHKRLWTGPPLSYKKIRGKIEKRLRKVR
jgi:hypothetical protein